METAEKVVLHGNSTQLVFVISGVAMGGCGGWGSARSVGSEPPAIVSYAVFALRAVLSGP